MRPNVDPITAMASANNKVRSGADPEYNGTPKAMTWLQLLAEECMELGKEANKLIRVLNSSSPAELQIFMKARCTEQEAEEELVKEFLDLCTCMQYIAKSRQWDPVVMLNFAKEYAIYKCNRTAGRSSECPRVFTNDED